MRKLLFCLVFILLIPVAMAATRKLPEGGAVMTLDTYEIVRPYPELKLDGKVYEGSPALQIRGERGELLTLNQMPEKVKVYVLLDDRTGMVTRMWVLSAEELQERGELRKPGLRINTPIGTITL